jgi:superfamily II DNA/RNA helicase
LETAKFDELGLSSKVYEAVAAAGYTEPTPIQAQSIPVAVTGQDVLGIAQTGTGKTAAFVLPMITRLETGRARARMPRSLILAPTRELAAQVAEAFEKYGVNHKLSLALLIGGVSFDDQNRKIDRGVDVLIATPGRLLDHIQRGKLLLTGVEILVIDEADRMLDMGFIPDIERICKILPPRRQTLFFSATMPPEIQRLVDQFLKDPARVEVARPATTAKTITQRFQYCAEGEDWAKREMLRDLIRSETVQNAIIFCNRKRDVAILNKSLKKHGFNAGELHGDMDQSSRMATLDKFRHGEITILAASDVAARGLDIPEVSHVFNFDVPWVADDYVHRIGRTGRAGREGFAATIVGPDDLRLIKDIEKVTGEAPSWIGDPPSEEDYEDSGKRRGRRGRGGSSRRTSSASDRSERQERSEAKGNERGEAKGNERGSSGSRRGGGRGRSREDQPRVEAIAEPVTIEGGAPPKPRQPSTAPDQASNSVRRARGRGGDRRRPNNPNDGFHEGNVPAFLQRPVRLSKPSGRAASSAANQEQDEKQAEDTPA